MELTKDKCKNCTVENMCTTGTIPNSDECMMKWVNNEEIFNEEFLIRGTNADLLTKEECEIAWNTIKGLDYYPIKCTTNEAQGNFQIIPFNELFSNEIALIDSIINEHFDNPPLKFEELKGMIGKPVYHASLKRWFVIGDVCINTYRQKLIKVCHNVVDVLFFEEDVFFAREVKE